MFENQVVVLNKGDYTTCAVNLKGATITSWRIENEEQIFLGRRTELSYVGITRGGISLAFPRHEKWNIGRKHGFARDIMWKLETGPTTNKNGDVFAEFSLRSDAYTESLWSSQFFIICRITLRERQLEIKLSIENMSGDFPMDFHCMHHAYFKVPDVAKCKIRGLRNCRYFHNQDPEKNVFTELRNEVTISQHTDILYQRISTEMYLDKTGDWEKVLKISKTNLPDMVLWNPWQEVAKKLVGLDGDEYKYFVALDLGMIASKMYLKPQTLFNSIQTYELIEPQNYHRQEVDDFYDYFDEICS